MVQPTEVHTVVVGHRPARTVRQINTLIKPIHVATIIIVRMGVFAQSATGK
ncbi:MAG: hypothetical protein HY975_03630 [Candidatus Kerfeldbacteria bacterium]|nr:hypothetical protein [Candidatus Kerfeldbacteria bacterium]